MSLPSSEEVVGQVSSGNVDKQASSLVALNRTVWSRRSEFTCSRQIRVKIGTWNVAATQGTEKDVAGWFVHGKGVLKGLSGIDNVISDESKATAGNTESIEDQESRRTPIRSSLPVSDPRYVPGDDDIDLYVLGLQEIVDVSSPTEVVRPYHDKAPGERWKSAVLAALPRGYSLIAEQQLIGLYILVYAAKKVAASISNVSCRGVGTGLMGSMGNKGAVSIRLVLGEATKLVFVNSHLAAGAQTQNVERRNWDADQIISRTRFGPIDRGQGVLDEIGDSIGDEDFAFWFGDLNYRLADLPGDDIRRLLMRHTIKEYEEDAASHNESMLPRRKADLEESSQPGASTVSELDTDLDEDLPPEEDPASLETTLASLLPHDELGDQIRKGKAFHQGWREGKIRFMPTYKYDVGSVGMFDSSEKKRAPSWCDRILYRSRKDYLNSTSNSNGMETAENGSTKMANAKNKNDAYDYDYDPENDAYESQDNEHEQDQEAADTKAQAKSPEVEVKNDIELEYYTSHQRVLSSDHKPLDAVFKITYTAVDLDRKSAVYQEVARDFDRRENELRPSLSVAVDTAEGKSSHESIDFGKVRFGEGIAKTLTVANTGQVDAIFGFVLHDHNGSKRHWLQIDCGHQPSPGYEIQDVEDTFIIAPGDAWTATVTFRVNEPEVAREIRSDMEDVLILRVLAGKDHFLTLRADWQRTTLGLSVTELIRLPEGGVRAENPDQEIKCSAPRELFRLTEALESNLERAVAEWSMKKDPNEPPPWAEKAWPFDGTVWNPNSSKGDDLVQHIQELLDNYQGLEIPSLDSLQKTELHARMLVRFLDSLHDGIVTGPMWSQLHGSMIAFEKTKKPTEKDRDDQCDQILEAIASSTPHSISFQLLMTMLRRMINEISMSHSSGFESEKGRQKKTVESLRRRYAQFFQNVLFRPRLGEEGNLGKEAVRNEARRAFILELCIEERPAAT